MAEQEKQSTGFAALSRFRWDRPDLDDVLGEDLLHAIGIDGLDVQ
jgi:hypothetical protein